MYERKQFNFTTFINTLYQNSIQTLDFHLKYDKQKKKKQKRRRLIQFNH